MARPGGGSPVAAAESSGRPRVVALGGGHGLAASLAAVRTYADGIVGIVSVADDGGSSGALRRELGLPAPGDLRRCLTALASDDSLLARSLEHRFDRGTLEGHPVGNLLIAGLTEAAGDFEAAIAEVGRLVGAVGEVYPATCGPVTLIADSASGPICGQVKLERAAEIRNLRFDPPEPEAPTAAVDAIREADQLIIGPGSFYTSVLATVAVPALRAAVSEARAQRVFVSNVSVVGGNSQGFELPDQLAVLAGCGVGVDAVVAIPGTPRVGEVEVPVALVDAADADGWGHDPALLGPVLAELWAH